MTTWVPQSPGALSWQGQNLGYVINGAWDDAEPWRDNEPWLDAPAWSPQAANSETWTVQGA